MSENVSIELAQGKAGGEIDFYLHIPPFGRMLLYTLRWDQIGQLLNNRLTYRIDLPSDIKSERG